MAAQHAMLLPGHVAAIAISELQFAHAIQSLSKRTSDLHASMRQSQSDRAHILRDLQEWRCCRAELRRGPHRPCCSPQHDTSLPQAQRNLLENWLMFLGQAKGRQIPKCSPACLCRDLTEALHHKQTGPLQVLHSWHAFDLHSQWVHTEACTLHVQAMMRGKYTDTKVSGTAGSAIHDATKPQQTSAWLRQVCNLPSRGAS